MLVTIEALSLSIDPGLNHLSYSNLFFLLLDK